MCFFEIFCISAHCLVIFQMLSFFLIFFISSTRHRLRRTPCPGPQSSLRWTSLRWTPLRRTRLHRPGMVPALQKHHQISTRRPPERERKGGKMGAEEGKKSAKFWAAFGPPPFEPPRCGARPTLGALTFSRSGPHPSAFLLAPPFGLPPFERRPSALHFFWVGAPTFLIFIMLLICSFFFVHF